MVSERSDLFQSCITVCILYWGGQRALASCTCMSMYCIPTRYDLHFGFMINFSIVFLTALDHVGQDLMSKKNRWIMVASSTFDPIMWYFTLKETVRMFLWGKNAKFFGCLVSQRLKLESFRCRTESLVILSSSYLELKRLTSLTESLWLCDIWPATNSMASHLGLKKFLAEATFWDYKDQCCNVREKELLKPREREVDISPCLLLLMPLASHKGICGKFLLMYGSLLTKYMTINTIKSSNIFNY